MTMTKMVYGLSSCPSVATNPLFQPPRKKTKAEVMAEVIVKSKEHKVGESVGLSAHMI
jgi:hypothetical protein